MPLWATPQRRAYLVELLERSGGLCVYGHGLDCPDPAFDCYGAAEERLIDGWKDDDRDKRAYLWRLEKQRLHSILKIKKRGYFDTIRREQYLADRPVFKVVAVGINAFTQRRVAKVEIPELERVIWVDVGGVRLSKNKLRRLSRRPRGDIPEEILEYVAKEVRRYI